MSIIRPLRLLFLLRVPATMLALLLILPSIYDNPLCRGFADLDWRGAFVVSLFAALYVAAIVANANLILLYGEYRLSGAPAVGSALGELLALPKVPSAAGPLRKEGINPPYGGWVFAAGSLGYLSFCWRTWSQHPDSGGGHWTAWVSGAISAFLAVLLVSLGQLWQTASISLPDPASPNDSTNIRPGPFLVVPFHLIGRTPKWLDDLYALPPVGWRRISGAFLSLQHWVSGLATRNVWPFRSLKNLLRDASVGYLLPGSGGDPPNPLPGHVFGVLLFGVSVLFTSAISFFGKLSRWESLPSLLSGWFSNFLHFPTLAYVLVLLIFVTWFLCGISFFVDRYPAGVLLAAIVLIVGTSQFSNTDHYYTVEHPARGEAKIQTEQSTPDRIIVVAAAGGGIHAAGWTATVLKGLNELPIGGKPEDGFKQHLAAVSSVSGGSVGAYFHLLGYDEMGKAGPEERESLVWQSMESSLEPIAWGLVYQDLAKLINPLSDLVPWGPADRGAALELSFVQHGLRSLQGRSRERLNPLLSDPAIQPKLTRSGIAFPVWLINSTSETKGQAVVFSNSAFPGTPDLRGYPDPEILGKRAGLLGISDIARGYEARTASAVRMSATFPYVSPAARACPDCASDYLVDGGYYDNYGLVSAITWIDQLLHPVERRNTEKPTEVLVLRIDSFPTNLPARPKQENWAFQLAAPLLAIYNARSSGQVYRDLQELQFLMDREWKDAKPTTIRSITFRYQPEDCACIKREPPLSWHLSRDEKACIRQAWESASLKPCIDYVSRYLTGEADPAKRLDLTTCDEYHPLPADSSPHKTGSDR
jgi:hypothetical protein